MTQTDLFAAKQDGWIHIIPDPSPVRLIQNFSDRSTADRLLRRLIDTTPWRSDRITVFGKSHELPRLRQWYGNRDSIYLWSGIEMRPLPWTPELLEIREKVQDLVQQQFNSVLLNYYRNGNDTVGWHSDNETGLGDQPFIASLSLGAPRDFMLRSMDQSEKVKITLSHGSLLTMGGDSQRLWQHSLPRRRMVALPRVNLTFRRFE